MNSSSDASGTKAVDAKKDVTLWKYAVRLNNVITELSNHHQIFTTDKENNSEREEKKSLTV